MQSKQLVRLLSFREIPYVNKKTGKSEVFALAKVLDVVESGDGDTFEFGVVPEMISFFKTVKQVVGQRSDRPATCLCGLFNTLLGLVQRLYPCPERDSLSIDACQ